MTDPKIIGARADHKLSDWRFERVETVTLNIIKSDHEYKSHESLAKALIQASVDAGQHINWTKVSEDIVKYPAPTIEVEEEIETVPAMAPYRPRSRY